MHGGVGCLDILRAVGTFVEADVELDLYLFNLRAIVTGKLCTALAVA